MKAENKRGMCACGQPLHYSDPAIERAMLEIVENLGEHFTVHRQAGGSYRVQRHYLALHGLKEEELPALAAAGIIEALP